jgi:hypothetical protein
MCAEREAEQFRSHLQGLKNEGFDFNAFYDETKENDGMRH